MSSETATASTAAIPFIRRRRFRLGVLMLGHMTVDMYAGIIAPLIVELQKRVDVKLSTMVLLVGVCHAVVNTAQPVAGILSSRLQRNHFIVWGPVLAMLLALLGVPGSFLSLAALMIAAHVGIGIYHPEGLVATGLVCGEHDHIGVPFFMSGGILGGSMGALIGSQWYARWGFDGFWLLAMPGILLLALIKIARLTTEKVPHAAAGAATAVTAQLPASSPAAPPKAPALAPPNFYLLLVLAIITCTPTNMLFMLIAGDIEQRWGVDGYRWASWMIATMGFTAAVAAPLWGKLSRRVSPFAIVAMTQLACLPVFLMLINSRTPAALLGWTIPAAALLAVSVFPLLATQSSRCRQLTAPLRAGLIIGGSWGVGALIASLSGKLTDYGVTIHQVFTWATVAMPLAAAMAAWIHLARPLAWRLKEKRDIRLR